MSEENRYEQTKKELDNYKRMVHLMQDVMIELDAEGRYCYVSPSYERTYGQGYVRCFGDFFCYSNGEMPRYFKWRTAKTRELMAILNHFKGQPVHRDQLLDWLWP
ncbi:hypothetical protein [Tindallia californiensis]|uniref:PAS domain S-box-containing protein n=1 Tax=Tindallia californiensis TaxID=159292 RepID=A0A1H3MEZ9_9FIRM|nr:hypothetical protein [Tindallia californiensis]SDY74894.1 hypothetical protein SAMN05192546_10499 [Tindallia californiensis]